MKDSKTLHIIIAALSGLILILAATLFYFVITSYKTIPASNTNYSKNVCWNKVAANNEEQYWTTGCKGTPNKTYCAAVIENLTSAEKVQYENWVADGKPTFVGCTDDITSVITPTPSATIPPTSNITPTPASIPSQVVTPNLDSTKIIVNCDNQYSGTKYTLKYSSDAAGASFTKDNYAGIQGNLCDNSTLSNSKVKVTINAPEEASPEFYSDWQIINYAKLEGYNLNIVESISNPTKHLVRYQIVRNQDTAPHIIQYSSQMMKDPVICDERGKAMGDNNRTYLYCGSKISNVSGDIAVIISCQDINGKSADVNTINSCDALVKSIEISK
jgi:hypothetical protein